MSMLYGMAPAPRSAREALQDGLRLWFMNWRSVLPVAFVGWAPGQLLCLSALVLPLAPGQRLLLSLLAFGLLVAGAMAPLLLLSLSGWLLLASRGLLFLSLLIGLCTSFLLSLQGQGAAVGLALLYADACAETGLPTRLLHLARQRGD